MADVTTHSGVVRPDSMELLTKADRVPERLRRLENAAASGLLGGGGGGVAGGAGAMWAITAWTASPALATGWAKYDLPATNYVAEPSDGITREADGGLKVKDAGWYQCQASMYLPNNTITSGVLFNTTANAEANAFGQSYGPAGLVTNVIGAVKLAAGGRLYLNAYAASAGQTGQLRGFSVYKIGGPKGDTGATGAQGPQGVKGDQGIQGSTGAQGIQGVKGDTGDTGPIGPAGAVEVYEQPDAPPADTEEGVIWIDTDAVAPIPAQGPIGPAGPQGVKGDKGDPGSMIDAQRKVGTGSGYQAIGSGETIYLGPGAVNPMRLSFTPAVNCWWEVEATVGILQKLDAAYHYAYVYLLLNPADADGQTEFRMIETQHSGVQQYTSRNPSTIYKLNAGIAYTCTAKFEHGGGSWQHHQGNFYLWIQGKAWAR